MLGLILLSKNNCYLTSSGKLPVRPPGDKLLLKNFIRNQIVSSEGYLMLPPSLRKVVRTGPNPTVAITIKELATADILFINRSDTIIKNGKEFRLEHFNFTQTIELWTSKPVNSAE